MQARPTAKTPAPCPLVALPGELLAGLAVNHVGMSRPGLVAAGPAVPPELGNAACHLVPLGAAEDRAPLHPESSLL